MSTAFILAAGTTDRAPAGRDCDISRPKRVLFLVIDEDRENAIFVVERHGELHKTAQPEIDHDLRQALKWFTG